MSLKTAGSKLDSCGQLPTNMELEKHVVNNGADPVLGQNAGSVQGSRIGVDTIGSAPHATDSGSYEGIGNCLRAVAVNEMNVCNFFRKTSKGKNIRKITTVYFVPEPNFEFLLEGNLYRCKLVFPPNAAFQTMIGPEASSFHMSKRFVFLDACKKLHVMGDLNDHLLPYSEDSPKKDYMTNVKIISSGACIVA